MKKILLLFVFILAGFTAKAQETTDKLKVDTSVNIDGTYQFEIINSRYQQPSIPGNLKELVLKNRNETKVAYVVLGPQVRLKILPLAEINKASFKPLPLVARVSE